MILPWQARRPARMETDTTDSMQNSTLSSDNRCKKSVNINDLVVTPHSRKYNAPASTNAPVYSDSRNHCRPRAASHSAHSTRQTRHSSLVELEPFARRACLHGCEGDDAGRENLSAPWHRHARPWSPKPAGCGLQWRCGLRGCDSTPRHSWHSNVGCRVWCQKQRREWALFDGPAF